MLTLLIGNRTGGFTCRLARCLTFAAAAFGRRCLQILLVNGFDVFHFIFLLNQILFLFHVNAYDSADSPAADHNGQLYERICASYIL